MKWVQLFSSLSILWYCLSLGLEWKLTFSSPVATAEFQICWNSECSILTASSFRIWNSLAGILSPLLAFFVLLRPSWLHTPRCLAQFVNTQYTCGKDKEYTKEDEEVILTLCQCHEFIIRINKPIFFILREHGLCSDSLRSATNNISSKVGNFGDNEKDF